MKVSKDKAKLAWKGSGDDSVDKIWFKLKEKFNATEFLGYENNKSEGVVLSLIKDGEEVNEITKGETANIITNQTPFYAESGGQIGDTGSISNNNARFIVEDTQKKLGDIYVHQGKLIEGKLKINEPVNLSIDEKRRKNIRAYHSATHLLHEALRKTLGKHVIQKGSFVGPDKLRFDFSHMKPIEDKELEKIEEYVNNTINTNSDVRTRLMSPKEAVNNGALALFGEKYGEEVRVLSMGKDKNKYFSTELCGGTHVKNTSEIGNFKIINQSAIASGIRRIEALRAEQLASYLKEKQKNKDNINQININKIKLLKEQILKSNENLVDLINLSDVEQIKKLTKQLEIINIKNILKDNRKNKINDKVINGINVRYQVLEDYPSKELKTLIDKGKQDLKTGIVIVYTIIENRVGIAIGVTEELSKKYDAVEFVKIGSSVIGGKGGGGRKDFAQAGGVDKNKITESFNKIIEKIK